MKYDHHKQVTETVRDCHKPHMMQYGGTWQIVFELGDMDYCREQCAPDMEFADVVAWAEKQIKEHHLSSAVIDWF